MSTNSDHPTARATSLLSPPCLPALSTAAPGESTSSASTMHSTCLIIRQLQMVVKVIFFCYSTRDSQFLLGLKASILLEIGQGFGDLGDGDALFAVQI